jgi:hypothetical protein
LREGANSRWRDGANSSHERMEKTLATKGMNLNSAMGYYIKHQRRINGTNSRKGEMDLLQTWLDRADSRYGRMCNF